jgi:hypothetical protein
VGELATRLGTPVLDTVSFVLLVGSAISVTIIILYHGAVAVRDDSTELAATTSHGD